MSFLHLKKCLLSYFVSLLHQILLLPPSLPWSLSVQMLSLGVHLHFLNVLLLIWCFLTSYFHQPLQFFFFFFTLRWSMLYLRTCYQLQFFIVVSDEFRAKHCEVNESLSIDFHTFQSLCHIFVSMDIGSIPSELSLRLAESQNKVPWKQKAQTEAINKFFLIADEFT